MKKVNDLLLNETRTKAHNAAVLKWNSQPKRSIKSVVKFFQNVGGSLILTKQQIQQNQKTPIVPQVITSAVQKLEHKKDLVK